MFKIAPAELEASKYPALHIEVPLGPEAKHSWYT